MILKAIFAPRSSSLYCTYFTGLPEPFGLFDRLNLVWNVEIEGLALYKVAYHVQRVFGLIHWHHVSCFGNFHKRKSWNWSHFSCFCSIWSKPLMRGLILEMSWIKPKHTIQPLLIPQPTRFSVSRFLSSPHNLNQFDSPLDIWNVKAESQAKPLDARIDMSIDATIKQE